MKLRLFRRDRPFEEHEARDIPTGELVIGRGGDCDWAIADPVSALSRRHCVLSFDGAKVWLRDTSTNGVFIGPDRRRLPKDQRQELKWGETIILGDYMLLVDGEGARSLWREAAPADCSINIDHSEITPETDASLLEAFCRGAGLENSAFVGEDAVAVMIRLGQVYRQSIEDLCELMNERADLKETLQLDKTTISARDNNPLKWAPARQVAIDLLREQNTGFLSGADALRAAFEDLRRHSTCLISGAREAVRCVLDTLDPAALEEGAKRHPLNLTLRHDGAWRRYRETHAQLAQATDPLGGRLVDRAFRAGYESEMAVARADKVA